MEFDEMKDLTHGGSEQSEILRQTQNDTFLRGGQRSDHFDMRRMRKQVEGL